MMSLSILGKNTPNKQGFSSHYGKQAAVFRVTTNQYHEFFNTDKIFQFTINTPEEKNIKVALVHYDAPYQDLAAKQGVPGDLGI
jgi:hypothetical protein